MMITNPLYSVDDSYYFFLVVKYGGFSAASEATTLSKSKLSRHVVELETKFKVQLIQRTTRYFKVTQIGQELYEECAKIMAQVDAAENVLTRRLVEPEGLIRLACPPLIAQSHLRVLIGDFLKTYPKVNISIEHTTRHIDVLNDNIDIVIRHSFGKSDDSDLIIKDLAYSDHYLVAHPDIVHQINLNQPSDLHHAPCLGYGTQYPYHTWHLRNKYTNEKLSLQITPRMTSNDFSGVYHATKDGLGIAELPYLIIEDDLRSGNLVRVLPHWQSSQSTLQIAYSQRKAQRYISEKLVENLIMGFKTYHEHKLDYAI